jgi:predicted MFS family arabinose efflux permease
VENPISASSPEGGSAQETNNNKKTQRAVIAIALFVLVIDAITVRSLSILAPFIRSELGIDKSQFGYIVSSFMVGAMLTTLPAGAIIGRLNIGKAFTAIMIALGVALFVVAGQNTLYGFMLTLFFVGLLRTGIPSLVNRVITEQFDSRQRGSIMGIIYAAVPLGGFLGAVILPSLAEYIKWNAGYLLLGGAAWLAALTSWKFSPKDRHQAEPTQSVMRLFSFRSRTFLILCLSYGLFVLSMTSEVFITLYLVDIVKISALIAGTFYGTIQLTGVGGRVVWGLLADRYFSHNRWWLLSVLNWLMVISYAFLTLLHVNSPWWLIAIIMIGLGLSSASSWGILCTLLGDIVGIASIAMATASIYFITNSADVLGPILFGYTLRRTNSYQTTLSVFIGIAVVSAIIFTWMAYRNKSTKGD